MEVITTHSNADFDAVAAMIAARKLYPEARLVFPGTQEKNVRSFIEKYQITFDKLKDIPLDQITRLIIVDCKSADRIGKLSEVVKAGNAGLHIYDHHPVNPGDLRGELEKIAEVGATTTIFVELLKERSVKLSQVDMILFAIAIYEETGSLTFPTTTPRDLMAVSYLLSCGLDLRTISGYLVHEMDADQIALLDFLIHNAKTYYIDNLKIVIARGETENYVSELSTITHKVRDMEDLDILFVLVRMEDKIQMVARSKMPEVDVGGIAREFGGGGHATAASASIRDLTTIQVEERLLQLLRKRIKPFKTAHEIMTSPVKTVQKDIRIEEAGDLMTRYGVNVLPVTDNDKVIGLITREIIQKTIFHKFGDQPVSDFMSTEFFRVKEDTPFREIESLMVEHGQRFLPVVRGDKIMGAITRTDILRALHEDIRRTWETAAGRYPQKPHERNLRNIMKDRLPKHVVNLLLEIGRSADRIGVPAYAVGGFVRDIILNEKNYDIDIVIEGDGIAFADKFASSKGARVRSHQRFGTAVIIFPDNFKIDIATARTEYYEYPTALPTVELSSIKKDLYRRDFTINTLAIKLNKKDFGSLIDFFGGQRDIKEKMIRVLHNLSFIEDPTRIYRAIRFEQRYGFRIGRHTQNLIRSATKIDLFHRLAGRRLFTELVLLLSEQDPVKPIARLSEFDLLRFIHPSLQWDDDSVSLFNSINDALAWYKLLFLGKKVEPWQIYFFALMDRLTLKATDDLCRRLSIREALLEKVLMTRRKVPVLLQRLNRMKIIKPSRLYGILKGYPQETLIYLLARTTRDEAKKGLSLYLSQLQDMRLSITGKDISRLGIKPGPLYGKVMEKTLRRKLDGMLKSREEELEFAKELLKTGHN